MAITLGKMSMYAGNERI